MQRFPDNILTGNPLRGMFIDHLMTLPSSFPHFPRDFGSKHLMHMFPAGRTVGNAYGFALGMHCKDMENAMEAIRAPHSDGKSFQCSHLPLVMLWLPGGYTADIYRPSASRSST